MKKFIPLISCLFLGASCEKGNLFSVKSSSMEPTLLQNTVIKIYDIRYNEPKRFDIVVILSPLDADSKLCSRVVGIPGDVIKNTGSEIVITARDGDMIGKFPVIEGIKSEASNSMLLKADEYFLIGDNLKNSIDSRVYGKIKRRSICGIVITKGANSIQD